MIFKGKETFWFVLLQAGDKRAEGREVVGSLGQGCVFDLMKCWVEIPPWSKMQKIFRGTWGRQKPSEGVSNVLEKLCKQPVQGAGRRWLKFYLCWLVGWLVLSGFRWIWCSDMDFKLDLISQELGCYWKPTKVALKCFCDEFWAIPLHHEQFSSCPCNLSWCNGCMNYSASFSSKVSCWIYSPPIQAYFQSCKDFSELRIEGAVRAQSVWLFRSHQSVLCSLF